jgi:hypothetical protein
MMNSLNRLKRQLSKIAFGLFLIALFSPSVQIAVLGKSADFLGFQAVYFSIEGLLSLLINGNFSDASVGGYVLYGCAALLNFALILSPLAIAFRPRRPLLLLCILLCSAGLCLSLILPVVQTDVAPRLLIGYLIWIVAFLLMLIALCGTAKEQGIRSRHYPV